MSRPWCTCSSHKSSTVVALGLNFPINIIFLKMIPYVWSCSSFSALLLWILNRNGLNFLSKQRLWFWCRASWEPWGWGWGRGCGRHVGNCKGRERKISSTPAYLIIWVTPLTIKHSLIRTESRYIHGSFNHFIVKYTMNVRLIYGLSKATWKLHNSIKGVQFDCFSNLYRV